MGSGLVKYSVLVLILLAAPTVQAKAAFMRAGALLERTQTIAIVDVSRVTKVEAKGTHWTYGQKAEVAVVEVLRGTLPDAFSLFAEKSFICARASYAEGRYLVFLKRDGDFWVTTNHHLGQFRIRGEQVQWFSDAETLATKWHPLGPILEGIKGP